MSEQPSEVWKLGLGVFSNTYQAESKIDINRAITAVANEENTITFETGSNFSNLGLDQYEITLVFEYTDPRGYPIQRELTINNDNNSVQATFTPSTPQITILYINVKATVTSTDVEQTVPSSEDLAEDVLRLTVSTSSGVVYTVRIDARLSKNLLQGDVEKTVTLTPSIGEEFQEDVFQQTVYLPNHEMEFYVEWSVESGDISQFKIPGTSESGLLLQLLDENQTVILEQEITTNTGSSDKITLPAGTKTLTYRVSGIPQVAGELRLKLRAHLIQPYSPP